jgi:hypothetical protein
MEHYFNAPHAPEEVIDALALLHSFASSQCKIIEIILAVTIDGQAKAFPREIRGLLTSTAAIEKTRKKLALLNISFFLH